MKILLTLLLSATALLLAGEKFAPGLKGNVLDGRARLTFDTAKLTPARGAAVFWFKSSQSADTMKNIMLLSFGINKPGWFYIHLNRGQFGVNVRATKGSTRVECPAKELFPGKWHHAAVVWGKRKKALSAFTSTANSAPTSVLKCRKTSPQTIWLRATMQATGKAPRSPGYCELC